MDIPPISPPIIIGTIAIGAISAYLAFKRGKNPYIWFALGLLFGIFGVFALFYITEQKKAPPPKREPVFNIDGPKDKFWYYLDSIHKQQGPMSHDALTLAWKEGKVDLSTFIWNEEMTDWKPLKETLKAD